MRLCGALCRSEAELRDCVVAAHGYTVDSEEVQQLIDVLCNEFSPAEQRLFLVYLTGCARLPIGGLPAVQPKITVVRKGEDYSASRDLPSCNTCFHFLKLPSYPTREVCT